MRSRLLLSRSRPAIWPRLDVEWIERGKPGDETLVTVEQDEDGVFVVECPAIPGCVSQGKTEQEALENIKDAIRECLEVRAERGMPLIVKTHEIEVAV